MKHYKHLHQHPELATEEKQTAIYCKDVFKSLGYTINDCWGYGFIADLIVPNAKKRIAFRADMDALPVQEKNSHNYISKNKGISHACGHDLHMAIALHAAELLKDRQNNLSYNIRFIFQPSEEQYPGGAQGMIANGCLDGVDEIYGLHNFPGLAVGSVDLRVGPFMAATAEFTLNLKGKGCHAALPHEGLNPILAASDIVAAWQAIPKKLNLTNTPILSVTQFHAGVVNNVIPDMAVLSGTVRALQSDVLPKIEQLMRESLLPLQRSGYCCELCFNYGYDCLINASYGVARVIAAAQTVDEVTAINSKAEPLMGAEDFCYYLQKIPGAFFFIGSGGSAPLHSSYFNPDISAIEVAAKIIVAIASLNNKEPE